MGARPLRRAIQRYIEDPLADFVLRSSMAPGSTVLVERDPDAETPATEVKLTILDPVPAGMKELRQLGRVAGRTADVGRPDSGDDQDPHRPISGR